MQLTELQDRVRARVQLSEDDPAASDVLVANAINEAVNFLDSIYDWPWNQASESVTSSSAVVGPIVDNENIVRIRYVLAGNTDRTPLKYISDLQYHDWYTSSGPTGSPEYYTTNGIVGPSWIYVWPIPDRSYSYTIVYTKAATDLTDPADTTRWPGQFIHAVVEYAAFIIFRQTYQFDKAQSAFQSFDNWLKALQDNRRRHSGPKAIRLRPWFNRGVR